MDENSVSAQSSSPVWIDHLAASAAGKARVVLPEGDDPRVQQAASQLVRLGISPLLMMRGDGNRRRPRLVIGVQTVTVAELASGESGALVAQAAANRARDENQTEEQRRDPLFLAAALVRLGLVDCAVAGATRPTRDVIRAGLSIIGLRAEVSTLSSSFLMRAPDGRVLAFADCAVIPEPDANQLAGIALSTAETYTALTGGQPIVAMLSFSTQGSAEHPSLQPVREAVRLVRERSPGMRVDGEIQFDAAFVPAISASKAPGSPVAGCANVFVFPNLSAGNLGYKIAQHLGGFDACGPILQGLRAPMNDLSRGCTADDVVNLSLVSIVQAATTASPTAAT